MKHLGTIIGTCIAGMFVMGVWGAFDEAYGIGGGWFAGFMIIGTMWLLNHYVGLIDNPGAWVDMALGIGVAGFARDVFMQGASAGVDAIPTLLIVLAGGITGGITAAKWHQYKARRDKEEEEEKAEA